MYHHEQGSSPPSDTHTREVSPETATARPPGRAAGPCCLPAARRAVPAPPGGEAAVTALLSPVIPSSARLPARGHGRSGAARRLPGAAVPGGPSAPPGAVFRRGRVDSRGPGGAGAARRLPVAAVPAVPSAPQDVIYGLGRMDSSGRVADRAVTSVLGWQPGDRLTFTASAGVVTARRDTDGMVTMPAKPYIVIPAALRRRCGLRPGDRVLLAVFPARDALAAYSFAVVDEALRAHDPAAHPAGGRP